MAGQNVSARAVRALNALLAAQSRVGTSIAQALDLNERALLALLSIEANPAGAARDHCAGGKANQVYSMRILLERRWIKASPAPGRKEDARVVNYALTDDGRAWLAANEANIAKAFKGALCSEEVQNLREAL